VKAADVHLSSPSMYKYAYVPSYTISKSCQPAAKLAHVDEDIAHLYQTPWLYIAKYGFEELDSKFHHPLSVQDIAL
jgi:hypothetical protein